MDSTTCLANASEWPGQLCALHINYGQLTEKRELQAFNDLCEHFEIPLEYQCVVDLPVLKVSKSALTGSLLLDDTGEAVSDESIVPLSYVPFRNAHILSSAVSWGESFHEFNGQRPKGIIELFIVHGAVEEDAAGYPDCRQEFYNLFTRTANVGTRDETHVHFQTPVISMQKPEIIKWAYSMNAPLSLTYSCYKSNESACGTCDSCRLRVDAFIKAGMIDPVKYEKDTVQWPDGLIAYQPIPEDEEE